MSGNQRSGRRSAVQAAIRISADILMVNVALVLALALRYVWLMGIQGSHASPQAIFDSYVKAYIYSFWLLTLISVTVFYFSGFYTSGQMYRGRYKALVVIQAVSLSYLIFSLFSFLFPEVISLPPDALLGRLPRGAWVLAWLFTLAFLVGSRLWSRLWEDLIYMERYHSPDHAQIKTVLVIGGAGYIGSALVPRLLAQGYRVRVLDLLLFGMEPLAQVDSHSRLEIVQADFRQVDQVVEAMRGVDAVVHLGAIVGDPACALDEELTIDVNVMATHMIAEVAKGNGVNRFIFASTCSVYGASDEVLDERSTLNPVSLYARSKIASEHALMDMAGDRFRPIILRFGTIYGLSGRPRFDLVVNLLAAKAAMGEEITIFGGDQWRPFVHVDDVARAISRVLEAPLSLVRNQVFNVGSDDQNYQISQVGELVHRLVPTARLRHMGSDTDRRNYRVSFAKIRRTLDFEPRWTVEQGVQQVIEAIKSGQVQDYRDSRYSNYKFLREEGFSRFLRNGHQWAYELLREHAYVDSV